MKFTMQNPFDEDILTDFDTEEPSAIYHRDKSGTDPKWRARTPWARWVAGFQQRGIPFPPFDEDMQMDEGL